MSQAAAKQQGVEKAEAVLGVEKAEAGLGAEKAEAGLGAEVKPRPETRSPHSRSWRLSPENDSTCTELFQK